MSSTFDNGLTKTLLLGRDIQKKRGNGQVFMKEKDIEKSSIKTKLNLTQPNTFKLMRE